jgi:hypothetical protein
MLSWATSAIRLVMGLAPIWIALRDEWYECLVSGLDDQDAHREKEISENIKVFSDMLGYIDSLLLNSDQNTNDLLTVTFG